MVMACTAHRDLNGAMVRPPPVLSDKNLLFRGRTIEKFPL